MTKMTKLHPAQARSAEPVVASGCLSPGRDPQLAGSAPGGYSRLFPDLPALGPSPNSLIALGQAGGLCDGGTAPREAAPAAGWPFFGQFIAHDITADRSALERKDHGAVVNNRTPRLNLECLYAAGPGGSPYLFDRDDPAKFLLAPGGQDVPRTAQGVAIIGDPRNDSHRFMAAMHLSFLKAHNALVDAARADGTPEDAVFDTARRLLTWHYHWIVVSEFLPGLAGPVLMTEIRSGRSGLPATDSPALPYEFADAAYRYGHSQIRQTYQLTPGGPERALFPDLLGFRPVGPGNPVDWRLMFDGDPDVPAQRAMRISERLPAALVRLPEDLTGPVADEGYRSLASRDLQRGVVTDLPSGESVARALGLMPLSTAAIGLPEWPEETPLWYYIAREADWLEDGNRLGPVGARLVAGVLYGLAQGDAASWVAQQPDWRPTIAPVAGANRDFGLLDLLLLGDAP